MTFIFKEIITINLHRKLSWFQYIWRPFINKIHAQIAVEKLQTFSKTKIVANADVCHHCFFQLETQSDIIQEFENTYQMLQ